jgi:hypothetical protein
MQDAVCKVDPGRCEDDGQPNRGVIMSAAGADGSTSTSTSQIHGEILGDGEVRGRRT